MPMPPAETPKGNTPNIPPTQQKPPGNQPCSNCIQTLQNKHISRLQPADIVRLTAARVRDGVETANLFHNQLRFGRLGVGDVDGAWPAGVELRQFLRQGMGCQVLAALRQGAFMVAEGRAGIKPDDVTDWLYTE